MEYANHRLFIHRNETLIYQSESFERGFSDAGDLPADNLLVMLEPDLKEPV